MADVPQEGDGCEPNAIARKHVSEARKIWELMFHLQAYSTWEMILGYQ